MGNCVHCGKPAGFLRSSHAECRVKHRDEQNQLAEKEKARKLRRVAFEREIEQAIVDRVPAIEIEQRLAEQSEDDWLTSQQRTDLICRGWARYVDHALSDDLLADEEISHLEDLISRFDLPAEQLNVDGALARMAKAVVLRQVMEGEPKFVVPPSSVNLRKGEGAVWVFNNVTYYEDKVRRQMVGGSQGVSVRIASGVYYRVGAFKAKPVEKTERVAVGVGQLVVSNQAMYFVSPAKSVRVPYEKIVSFEQFTDGIGFMRDAATAKPQGFVTGDGWFTCNLVQNLVKL